MRKLVFAQPSERKDLEAILHPLIRQESTRQIQESTQPYVVLVVPLLIESGDHGRALNRILVVDCEPQTQVNRVMQRSGLSRNEVLSIIAAQAPRELRLSEADDIIHNDSDLETLRAQVKAVASFLSGSCGRWPIDWRQNNRRCRQLYFLGLFGNTSSNSSGSPHIVISYEFPLNERIRTLLRLEDLYQRAHYLH
jgi:hypothetical protein